jgi:hypothetical protein
MDLIEAKRYCLIVEKAKQLSTLLNGGYGSTDLHVISSYYDNALIKYNNTNRCTIDKTRTEIGAFESSAKKIIRANSYRYKKGIFDDWATFYSIMDHTKFSEDLIDSYILFNRKYPWGERTEISSLRRVLLDTFRILIISEFEECNRKILF